MIMRISSVFAVILDAMTWGLKSADLPLRPVAKYPGTKSVARSCLRSGYITRAEAESAIKKVVQDGDSELIQSIQDDWSTILRGLSSSTDRFRYWEKKIGEQKWLVGICVLRGNETKSCIFLGQIEEVPTTDTDPSPNNGHREP